MFFYFSVKGFAIQPTKLEALHNIWLKKYEHLNFGRSFSKSTRSAFFKLKTAVNQFLEGCHEVVPPNQTRGICFEETNHLNVLKPVYHEANTDFVKRKFLINFRRSFVSRRLYSLLEVSKDIVESLDKQENRKVINIIHTFSIGFVFYEGLLSDIEFFEAISNKLEKKSKTLVQNYLTSFKMQHEAFLQFDLRKSETINLQDYEKFEKEARNHNKLMEEIGRNETLCIEHHLIMAFHNHFSYLFNFIENKNDNLLSKLMGILQVFFKFVRDLLALQDGGKAENEERKSRSEAAELKPGEFTSPVKEDLNLSKEEKACDSDDCLAQTTSEELVEKTLSAAVKQTNAVDEQKKTDCETSKVEDEVPEVCEEIQDRVTNTHSDRDALFTPLDCCADTRLTATEASKKEIFETKSNNAYRITELEKQFYAFKKFFSLKFENGLKRLHKINEENLETINGLKSWQKTYEKSWESINKIKSLLEGIDSKLAIDGCDSENTKNHKSGELISYKSLSEFLDTSKKPSFKLSN